MMPIQVFLLIIFILAVVKVVSRYRANELSGKEVLMWLIFWIGGMIVAIQPNITARFAKFFGVGRGADFVVYLSLALLFFIVFRLMVKIEKLNRDITLVVRKDALKNKLNE
jgi:hypothetical protein